MSQKSSRKRGGKRHDEPKDLLLKSLHKLYKLSVKVRLGDAQVAENMSYSQFTDLIEKVYEAERSTRSRWGLPPETWLRLPRTLPARRNRSTQRATPSACHLCPPCTLRGWAEVDFARQSTRGNTRCENGGPFTGLLSNAVCELAALLPLTALTGKRRYVHTRGAPSRPVQCRHAR